MKPEFFASPSRLIGRTSECAELEQLLHEHRVVTLWGPAGMGKSRLAMHLAERAEGRGEPAVFAELANVHDREGLVSALAHALDLGAPHGPRAHAAEFLRRGLEKRAPALLVWDNVEQITEVAATLLAELHRGAGRTRFLLTTRELLRIAPERAYELLPLGLPVVGEDPLASDAVRLLVERGQAAGGSEAIPSGDLEGLGQIVTELEGVPLAIELAAARLGVLGVRGLTARLGRKLDVLSRGRRDMPSRQSSLRGAVAWSWELLTTRERTLLSACSVFRGSFDLEAAVSVAQGGDAELKSDDVIDCLGELRDKSLLRAHREPGRLALFESTRAFAEELQEEAAASRVSAAHLNFYEARARAGRCADDDLENFSHAARAALRESRLEAALELTVAVDAIVSRRGPFGHHLALLDQVVEAVGTGSVDLKLVAAVLVARGQAHAMAGRANEAARDFDRATATVSQSSDDRLLTEVLLKRGLFLHRERRLDEATVSYERAAELLVRRGDAVGHGRAVGNLGAVSHDRGDLAEAARRYEEAISILRRAGERRIAATLEGNFGLLEQERGALELARVRFERAVSELEAVGERRLLAIAIGNLGALSHEAERLDDALRHEERALRLLAGLGDKRSEAIARSRLGAVLADLERLDEGEASLAAARRLLLDTEDHLAHGIVDIHEAFIELARGRSSYTEGDAPRGSAFFELVRSRIASALVEGRDGISAAGSSDDVRVAVRILERGLVRAVASQTHAPLVLIVEREARWFRIGAGAVEWLDKRRAPRLLLLALAKLREQAPGLALDGEALFAAGWPGERVLAEAQENRVNVALAFLRRGSLRPLLIKGEGGYQLDANVPVLWSDREP